MKLTSTRIVTRDVSTLARFYRDITGMAPIGSEDYVEFESTDAAGTVLALCSQQAMELFGAGAAVAASNRSMMIDFEVGDVDAERRRLEPIIATFVQEPTDQPWGNRSMLFRDPDGNLIQFFAPIPVGRRETNSRCDAHHHGRGATDEQKADAHENDE